MKLTSVAYAAVDFFLATKAKNKTKLTLLAQAGDSGLLQKWYKE